MILKLDNLIHVTEDVTKIAKLKDLGAVEIKGKASNVVKELDKVADEDEPVGEGLEVDFKNLKADEMKAVLDDLKIEYPSGATKTQLEELYKNIRG